jgi:hypothetical protein
MGVKIAGESPITKAKGWFTGEDQTLRWIIDDASQDVVDISGWTIQFRMSATATGTSVLTKSATLTDPTNGVCSVAILAADTPAFTPGVYHYTLSRIDAGSNQVLSHGTAVLQGRVA